MPHMCAQHFRKHSSCLLNKKELHELSDMEHRWEIG